MITNSLLKRTLTHFIKSACQSSRTFVSATKLETKNLQEIALDENCILVDEFDRPLGQSSKRDCHRVGPDGDIKLHRAFSVFLFNSNGDMLIQKRASQKVMHADHLIYLYSYHSNHHRTFFSLSLPLFLAAHRLHFPIVTQTPVAVTHCTTLKAN